MDTAGMSSDSAAPQATGVGKSGVGTTQGPEDSAASLLDGVRGTSELLASGTALVGIGGGLMYAMVALGYQQFYGSFGLTPSDVGITQSDIIAQTAVALVVAGSLTFFVWLPFYIILMLLFRFTKLEFKLFKPTSTLSKDESKSFRRKSIVGSAIVITLACLYVFLAYRLLARIAPVLGLRPYLAVAQISLITMLTVLVTRQKGRWSRDALRTLGRYLAVALLATLLLGIDFAIVRAENLSALISEGYVFPPGPRFTFFFDIRDDPVCVKDLSGSPSLSDQAMYYFGRSGDLIVLYDAELRRTFIRPAAGVELAFVPYRDWPAYRINEFDCRYAKHAR